MDNQDAYRKLTMQFIDSLPQHLKELVNEKGLNSLPFNQKLRLLQLRKTIK